MPRNFDINNYAFDDLSGKWYHSETGEFVRNKNVLRRIYEVTGRQNTGRAPKASSTARSLAVNREMPYRKYFKSKTPFNSGGVTAKWARGLTLQGGKNPNFNWRRVEYRSLGSSVGESRTGRTNIWGSNVNRGKKGGESMAVFESPEQLLRHLEITMYQIKLQSENWRVMVGQRALKVFDNSFKYERFYTHDSAKWHPLSDFTLRKKRKRKQNNGILKEYGDLRKSLELNNKSDGNETEIITKDVKANKDHHKYHTLSYAALHNEGMGTIGRSGRHHIKRQFMGHSTYLDPFKDTFMSTMMKRYLFDSVFLTKKK